MGNILNDLPKRIQPRAKGMLREMMYAETPSAENHAKKEFLDMFHAKYPKAVDRLKKDWPELTAFTTLPRGSRCLTPIPAFQ